METILSDLAIGLPFVKGQNLPVRNCWHFSTDGTVRDVESRGGAISRLVGLSRENLEVYLK